MHSHGIWRTRWVPTAHLRVGAWFFAALLVAAILLTAAFQNRPTYVLGVGDTPHDTGLVRNFNAAEQQDAQDGGRQFRWTRGTSAVAFPGIGRGRMAIDLVLNRSVNPNADTTILANDTPIATVQVTPDFQTYHVEAPATVMTRGSLTLGFVTEPFSPPNDRRMLGVVVQEVRIHAADRGPTLPPARITLSLWLGVVAVALSLLIAGIGGMGLFAGAIIVAASMAAFVVWNRLFLTANAGGVVRAGVLMVVVVIAIRLLVPPLCRRLGTPTTARDVRWLAVIAGFVLALRFAGVLHPGIIVGDLTFHVHRFEDVAVRHTLVLPVNSKEFGGRTIFYAPTPYLVMIPLSWVIHNRVLMLFVFALGIDAIRFCIFWFVARRVAGDLRTANLIVLVMALMPVGWIVYSWGIFANIFAEGMLTLLFALLILGYEKLTGPRRWWWCALFAAVICLTLLAHIGVFVLTAATLTLYLLGRIIENLLRHARPWANGVIPFVVAGLTAATIAFALFYRIPARDLLSGATAPPPVEQEATNTQTAPPRHEYRTGGATPDFRNGLPAITTPHLSVALARETWEMSYAFYRVWPIPACLVGIVLLWRARRTKDLGLRTKGTGPFLTPGPSPSRKDHGRKQVSAAMERGGEGDAPHSESVVSHLVLSPQSSVLTLGVWMLVAAIMLVVGIVAQLYVRYPLYALPAVSMGAGVLLAWLVGRGRWGTLLTIGLLAVSVVYLALFWYSRIVYDWKIPV